MHRAIEEDPRRITQLVRDAREGDAVAFRTLVETYMRPIYALSHRMLGRHDDADDVAQETFVRAWQALDRYDGRFSFHGWLRTIATRLALNELDKRRRRQTHGGVAFDVAAETQADPAPDPQKEVEAKEMQERLQAIVQTLPDEFRVPLVLRSMEELSYDEIARILDVPVGTIMSRLHRARQQVRRALQQGSSINGEGRDHV
jgi:RNA polymerase sigma-70 factor (ECF subfamily)